MLVGYMIAGARGTICANANVVPELVRAVYDAVRAGELDDALRYEARLRAVQAAFNVGSLPAAYKSAAAVAGTFEPWLVPPRLPLTKAETVQLIERLAALGVF
jgi:dihydrodipicolinate synthase/N-acetylneuraminate lyase